MRFGAMGIDGDSKPVRVIKPMALPGLTGIRGVAALWVVLFHIQNAAAAMGLPFLAAVPILKDGFRGVDLFFLLSGFILTHVHQGDFLTFRFREVLRFAALRVVRVYPLSLVVLAIIALMVLPLPGFIEWYRGLYPDYANSYSAMGFVQTAVLANRWFFLRDFGQWNDPTWTVSIELLAYTTFPALAFMSSRAKSRSHLLAVAFGLLVGLILFQVADHRTGGNMNGRLAIVRAMACFPAGVALYRVSAFKFGAESGDDWGAAIALASTIFLLLVLLIPNAAVLAPLCFAGVITGVRLGNGIVNTVLCSRVVMFFGEISFALYLVHVVPLSILLWMVERYHIVPAKALLALTAYLAAVIVFSFLLHKFIELPTQRYGRGLIAKLFEASASHPAIEPTRQTTDSIRT